MGLKTLTDYRYQVQAIRRRIRGLKDRPSKGRGSLIRDLKILDLRARLKRVCKERDALAEAQ